MEKININDLITITKNMSPINKEIYLNLYKNYLLLNNKYSNQKDIEKELQALEDRIYTVNNKKLTQRDRILIEIKNITRTLKKNNIPSQLSLKIINELKDLSELLNKKGTNNPEIISYLKKEISVLQASLGMNINFFYDAFELFNEKILLDKKNK